MLHVVFSVIAIKAIHAGLGTKDQDLNDYLQNDARHVSNDKAIEVTN
jgi:hypothetical protein